MKAIVVYPRTVIINRFLKIIYKTSDTDEEIKTVPVTIFLFSLRSNETNQHTRMKPRFNPLPASLSTQTLKYNHTHLPSVKITL